MDKITTIANTTISDTTRVCPTRDEAAGVCWCGQDMDCVRGGHCPRCGTARATWCEAALPRLAA
jgi:hypothetical protein